MPCPRKTVMLPKWTVELISINIASINQFTAAVDIFAEFDKRNVHISARTDLRGLTTLVEPFGTHLFASLKIPNAPLNTRVDDMSIFSFDVNRRQMQDVKQAEIDAPGLVNLVSALACHLCHNWPTAFTQPGASYNYFTLQSSMG